MKIFISPAKLMDLNCLKKSDFYTKPIFLNQTKILQNELKKLNITEISNLMNLSPKLSEINWQRNQIWKSLPKNEKSIQAIFAFKGEVYRGLEAENLSDETLEYAQNHLFILSGLYGIVRPFDKIMEYRLEMGSKFEFLKYKNLYEFWQESLTKFINKDLKKNEILINLASSEYIKVIDSKKIKNQIIDVEFKEFRNGKYMPIMSFLKHARGTFARFILENKLTKKEELYTFNKDNYCYNESLSEGNKMVFTR